MSYIYIAAPPFTLAEQDFNQSLAEYLIQQGFEIFLPQKECSGMEGKDIYITCLRGVSMASAVVAILDGADADSGTCWECGYASAKGIPVVAVRTDFRNTGDTKGFNAMLYYSASIVVEGTHDLFPKILNTLKRLASKP